MRHCLAPFLVLGLLSAPLWAADAPPPAGKPPAAASGSPPASTAPPPSAPATGTASPKGAEAPPVAPDTAREKAIAEALLPRVRADQAVWLDVDGAKVLALYDGDIDGKPHGTAVILHGMDANPDMHGIVHALRTRLVHYGWSTLSVQLPVLAPGTAASAYAGTLAAAGKRLQAALAYLKEKQPGPIVLVGYEYGGLVALQAAGGTPAGIAAIAALDLSGTRDILAPAEVDAMLEKVRVPVLDLFGALDPAARLDLAPPRAAAARKAGNAAYRQEPLAGTDEHFTGMAQPVASRISAWLGKVTKTPPPSP